MSTDKNTRHNKPKYIIGNAFIACVLAVLLMMIVIPLGMVVINLLSGHSAQLYSDSFWFGFSMISLAVGFYGGVLILTWGFLTLLIVNKYHLNYPVLVFFIACLYTMIFFMIFLRSFHIFTDPVFNLSIIFCGGICGFTACYLFNKKCQSRVANGVPNP